ncbi:MAG: hypothetical protein LAP61_19885 [Acidobacteriia bacterium]|nr:hypothetical protein [Terriglobia bacterium]
MKRLVAILIAFAAVGLSHETLTTTVLFDREIVRVLDKHCVMCHTEDGPSFPLMTYEQTWLQKRPIRADAIARHMPPWAAVSGYGQFVNENNLTLRETQFIISWVEGLGPRNAGTVFTNTATPGAARPKEVQAHTDFGTWHLGEPQLKRQLPANTIDPEVNEVRRSLIDLGLTSERRIRALEFMPSDRRVIRAAFFTVQETGQWIGSWTPWYGFMSLPKETAYRLPPGSHVVAEIHYRGGKERVVEQGTLGLFFADQTAADLISDVVLENKTRLDADTYVVALRPDIQPGVKSIEVSARKPDGGTEVLLFAKDIPVDWPTPYILKEPVRLPRGTVLSVTGTARSTVSVYRARR